MECSSLGAFDVFFSRFSRMESVRVRRCSEFHATNWVGSGSFFTISPVGAGKPDPNPTRKK